MPRDDIHRMLLDWAHWHARHGSTGASPLAAVIERQRIGMPSGAGRVTRNVGGERREVWQAPQRDSPATGRSRPPLGVEAPAEVLRVQLAMDRIAEHGDGAAVIMETLRVHYLASHRPEEARLEALGISRSTYRRRRTDGKRMLGVALLFLRTA